MEHIDVYPIGTPGTAWGEAERREWLSRQTVQRSYRNDVVARVKALDSRYEVTQYGALSRDAVP